MTRAAAVVAVLFAASLPAFAQDFQVGSRAKGMGGSYTAFSDDPVSIWLNPAGIARQDFSAALHYQTFTQYELQRDQGFIGTLGKAESGLTDPAVVPSYAGILSPFEDTREHAFGFALIRPFENRLTYDFPAPPAVVAQTEQQFWRFRFAYGHDFKLGQERTFLPHVAFGVAADVAYTRYEFQSFSNSGVVIDSITDTSVAPGYGGGVLVSLYDDGSSLRFDLGGAWQSKVNFDLQQDEATFASWDWPPMANAGFTLYLLGQRLKITGDAQWIGWDLATRDSDDPLSPDIENAVNYSAGAEYELRVAQSVWIMPRAGYRIYDAPWGDEDNLPSIALTKMAIDTEAEKFGIVTAGFGFRWQTSDGKFRGVDFGAEFGGDSTNYSMGYTHLF